MFHILNSSDASNVGCWIPPFWMSSFSDADLTQMQPCKASDDFLIRVALFSANFAKPAYLALVWRQKPDGMAVVVGAKRLGEVAEQKEVSADFEHYPGSARDVCHVSRTLEKRRLAQGGFLRFVEEGEDHRWWQCKWWWWR